MATAGDGSGTRYQRLRGSFWRSAALLLAAQAACAAAGAGLAYVVAGPEFAKDYYSAHRTVKATWELLVPALALGAAAGFLLGGALSVLVLRRLSGRMLAAVAEVDGVLRRAGAGRLGASSPAAGSAAPAEEASAALAPLREHVVELRRLAKGLQRPALELTYRAAATADIQPRDLRPLAGSLEQATRDLEQALAWFED